MATLIRSKAIILSYKREWKEEQEVQDLLKTRILSL